MFFKDEDLEVRTERFEGGLKIKIKLEGSIVLDESKVLFLARSCRAMFKTPGHSVGVAAVSAPGSVDPESRQYTGVKPAEVRMPVTAPPQAVLQVPPDQRKNQDICPICHRKLSFHGATCARDQDRFNCTNCGYTEPVFDRK